ncbi:MAG TPA: hypothetical protein VGI34_00955 [Candidatus Acidoferrales bacterium]
MSENEVPGLGFDIPHLAAISSHFPFNPSILLNGDGVHGGFAGPVFFIQNPNFQGVPGLGFDYPHLAAISGNIHLNPAFTHFGLGVNDNSFAPIFWNAFPESSDYVDPAAFQRDQQEMEQQGQPQPQQQPQIIVVQQPWPSADEGASNRVPQAHPNSMTSSNGSTAEAAPVRDVGEFVFVRRDGKILFGSAFFISEGMLQYVTPEGIRHTVPVNELDAESTRKMNESLGTKVDLHR